MSSPSESSAQQQAEKIILEAVSKSFGVTLKPKRLTLTSGAVVDVDGVAENDESVLVEIFAHQGMLKGGQRHKIANDMLKLITIARDRELKPRLVLAFADPAMTTYLAGRSWLAAAIQAWGVEVVIAKLDDAVLEGLRAAQLRQVMMNPPAGADS